MRSARFSSGRTLLLLIFVVSHLTLTGCNDDSKTTGTMLKETDEDRARIQAKLAKYKERSEAKIAKKKAATKAKNRTGGAGS
jgi:hypothetical protein